MEFKVRVDNISWMKCNLNKSRTDDMKKCWNDNDYENGNRYQRREWKINVTMNTKVKRKSLQ